MEVHYFVFKATSIHSLSFEKESLRVSVEALLITFLVLFGGLEVGSKETQAAKFS